MKIFRMCQIGLVNSSRVVINGKILGIYLLVYRLFKFVVEFKFKQVFGIVLVQVCKFKVEFGGDLMLVKV